MMFMLRLPLPLAGVVWFSTWEANETKEWTTSLLLLEVDGESWRLGSRGVEVVV